MNLVVTGMAPREEAVFGVFLSRAMKNWTWQSVPAQRDAVLPKADVLIADLVSLGLGKWSKAAEADLLKLLQGTPAVLLLPSSDRTWAMLEAFAHLHSLVWLTKPYGAKEMQAALEAVAQAVGRAIPPFQPVLSQLQPPEPQAEPLPAPVVPVLPPEPTGLSATELHQRLLGLPAAAHHVFLRKLSAMLSRAQPFEVRFTVQNSLIVHPLDGWVATNTPMLVIERVCQSDAMASALDFREIDGSQAEERMERLSMPPQELEVFLHELVAATLT